jgi:hypothetical protein
MIDERDISQEKAFYFRQRASKVIENLQKRKMHGQYAADKNEALSMVMEMIPPV